MPIYNTVKDTPKAECHGTGWLQRHQGTVRDILRVGGCIRWVNELSGLAKGVFTPARPDGCDPVRLAWSDFINRPARIGEAVRDGATFEVRAERFGRCLVGYLTYWDDTAIGDGAAQRYRTREGRGHGWREVTRTFADPADATAVRSA
jgi:hypothetical protein